MIKTILTSAATTLFVLLVFFHFWFGMILFYFLFGFLFIRWLDSTHGNNSLNKWFKDRPIDVILFYMILMIMWPGIMITFLVMEKYVQFHKPITFHKPKHEGSENK